MRRICPLMTQSGRLSTQHIWNWHFPIRTRACEPISCNVRFWPLVDIGKCTAHVRSWGKVDIALTCQIPASFELRHSGARLRPLARNAAYAGIELLRATGHADEGGPWLPVGVRVRSGVAFVGSIGTERGTHEFAALGETMNLGARLVTAAGAGEVVISDAIWPDVAGKLKAERRAFNLKGIDRPVMAHIARVEYES